MGLQVNQQKSASNVEDELVFGDKLDDFEGYKYLGVLEDSRNVIKEENKTKIREKIIKRVEALCQTRLNAKNLFHAINEFAISTINYYIGIIDYQPQEFENLDSEIRQVLAKYKVTRNASNVDRLYLSREELGRGLQNIKEKSEIMLMNLYNHLDGNESTKPIMKVEKILATHFGLIIEYLEAKYELSGEINFLEVRTKQKEVRMKKINEKRMHSILFENEENHIDTRQSSLWLKKGNISPQEEGMLCKLQDRNLFYNKNVCHHCHKGNMSVDHLATSCGRLLEFDYKKRHNDIVRCIHFMMTKIYGLNKRKRLKNYKVEKVISNDRVRIKSDIEIVTDNRIDHNKPDLLIHDLKLNEITIIEVGVTNKRILPKTETTKGRKYQLLAGELKLMFRNAKVNLVPVVLTWDGLVTRHFKRYMDQIGVSQKLQAYIQAQTLKRTCESVMVDVRSDLNRRIDYDELSNLFDTL